MRIGVLAAEAGCQAGTIRYYESIDLMPSARRSEGDYRIYTEWHLDRLRFILQCRALGLNIDDIRTLLRHRDNPNQSCEEIDNLINMSIVSLEAQIASLRHLENHLKDLRSRCRSPTLALDCGILAGLTEEIKCNHGAKD